MKSLLAILLFAASAYGQGACILKQSTASQEIALGRFVDSTDGNTEETGLSIANTDVRLKKGTADWAAKNSGGATHEEAGMYRITLDATDTATLGILEIAVHVAGALDVNKTCLVTNSGFYDLAVTTGPTTAPTNFSSFSIDASGRIDLGKILGTAVSTPATAGVLDVNIKNIDNDAASASGTVTFPNATLASTTNITAGTITTVTTVSGLAANSITATAIAADAIGASELAADAIGASEIAADAIGAAEIAAAAIDRATYATDTGHVSIRSNTATAGAAGTITLDASASAVDDFYNNATILLTGGTGAGQTRAVQDYTGSSKVATVNSNWATNPDNTTTFALLPMGLSPAVAGLTAADIWAYATRDLTAGAITSTTFASAAITAASIATDAIGAAEIADGAIDAGALASDAITAAKIAPDAIGATEVADGAIDAATLASDTITAAKIATDAITAAKIAADALGDSEIATGAIASTAFAAGAIDAAAVAADAIGASEIATNAIGAAELADASIDRATFAVDTGMLTIRSNTATGGAAGSITLDTSASAVDDFYDNATILLTGGTGSGQTRVVQAYSGSTKIATVNTNWATNPDATTTFALLPMGLSPAVSGLSAGDVWAYATRQLTATQAFNLTGNITGNLSGSVGTIGSGVYYLKTATATTGNRIHFIPFASNGNPTKSATGVACQISLDGSAPASISDTPTEVEFTTGAYWQFDLNLAETSGKAAVIMCTGSGMVATPLMVEFQN